MTIEEDVSCLVDTSFCGKTALYLSSICGIVIIKVVETVEFLTKDQFSQTVTASDLVEALEAPGYSVLIEKRPALTPEQRRYATRKFFSEPEVLRQLEEAKEHMKNGNMDYFNGDEEGFAKLVDEVNAGK